MATAAATVLTGSFGPHADAPPIPAEVLAGDLEAPDLEGLLAEAGTDGHVPWQITGRATAEWSMTRLAEARRALEPIRERHVEWRRRLADLERTETAALERQAAFFEAHLKVYALEERRTGGLGKEARLRLANGYVQTVASQPRVEVAKDLEADLIAWVRAHWPAEVAARVVQVTETVPLTGLKLLVEVVGWPVEVLLSCGHPVEVGTGLMEIEGTGELLHPLTLEPGRGVVCPECSAEALVASIVGHRPAVVDAEGREPAGVVPVPASYSATVHPAR